VFELDNRSHLTLEKAMERFKRAVEDKRLLWEREGRPYRKTLAVGDRLEGFVYDTCEENGIELEMTIEKPTVLFFSRYYSCPVCQMNIEVLKESWEQIDKMGVDLKFVLQSTQETIKNAFKDDPLPFDIICDPKAVLYDRYNIFEADSDEKLVAGDSQALKAMGGARNMLLNSMVSSVEEGRKRQLSAVFVVNPDMTIAYAYYSRTLTDLPDFDDIIQAKL
jgi:peroxiredoxin